MTEVRSLEAIGGTQTDHRGQHVDPTQDGAKTAATRPITHRSPPTPGLCVPEDSGV